MILANLRADGSKERKIPHGFLFEYVTSPNYTCEILAWIGFSVMTQSWAGMCTATYILTRALTRTHANLLPPDNDISRASGSIERQRQ